MKTYAQHGNDTIDRSMIKMDIDHAAGYANELPIAHLSVVSKYLDTEMMARILEKMKRHSVEKFICHELKQCQTRVLDIAMHLTIGTSLKS